MRRRREWFEHLREAYMVLMEDRWKQELADAGIGYRPPNN
jgi:hypothetical protein